MPAPLLSRLLASVAASLTLAFAAGSACAADTKSVELATPHTTDVAPGKIEVLEFFAYNCPHCYAMEAPFEAWIKSQPDDVEVHRVPIAFNAGMRPMQQLYYTLEAMDRLDLHPVVFTAIHQEHKRLFTENAIMDWAKEQGLDAKKFKDTFSSFGVNSQIQRADTLAKSYAIEGTPTLAVGGRYLTSPSQANGYSEAVTEADRLVKQIREQK